MIPKKIKKAMETACVRKLSPFLILPLDYNTQPTKLFLYHGGSDYFTTSFSVIWRSFTCIRIIYIPAGQADTSTC